MTNTSLAAQAVIGGPQSLAPPSFDGHGWLVVINLAGMTAVCVLAVMFAVDAVAAFWRNRHRDMLTHPVTIWRAAGFCFACGIALRTGAEALVLWNWNPVDPIRTGWWTMLKRYLDPVSLCFAVTGLGVLYLSARGMVGQLRRRPFPIDMWASLPMLKRPAAIGLLSLIAAIGVVSTR
ncbi:hypothetical protein [Sphingomonas sp.]|uniref:hypothetical protein n=1 Tax=Sphingomonas sp. TaxID=28214 RepID=UPI003B00CBCE